VLKGTTPHERLKGNPNHLVGARSNPRNPEGLQAREVLTGQRPDTSITDEATLVDPH
jgi:hypothetical protein